MFFSEVSLGQGESVYPDLKERGEGGVLPNQNPKTNALSRVVFSTPRGKFFPLSNISEVFLNNSYFLLHCQLNS